jgi:hypothetical protein
VIRPWLLLPPFFLKGLSSDFSGLVLVISSKVAPVIPLRPGDVGLYTLSGTLFPLFEFRF